MYSTAVFSGLRAGELAGLRWDDVSFDRRLITVQRSYKSTTKSGELRHVPLLDGLLEVLKEWRLQSKGPLVFPNYAGNMHRKSDYIFQETLHRVLDRARFPKVERRGKLTWYITWHGTRHSFASHWMMRSGDLFKLQRILGHADSVTTQRYAHLAPSAFDQDHARFSGLAPGRVAEVIPLVSPTGA
jgi:integrase